MYEDQVDDSTGVTETETTEQEVSSEGQEAEAVTQEETEEGLEDVVYEIGDLQATASEIKSWREAHETTESKNKDYTQKTQALSEQRKSIEAKQEQIEKTLEFFESLEGELDELMMGDLKNVDLAELIEDDPRQYESTRQKIESRKKWKDNLQKKLNEKSEQLIAQNQETLFKKLDWVGNEAKFKSDSELIMKQVKAEGISQRSFSKVTDPGFMTALLKANKYDELMAKKTAVAKQVKQAPKVAKPKQSSSEKPKSLAERMYPNMK